MVYLEANGYGADRHLGGDLVPDRARLARKRVPARESASGTTLAQFDPCQCAPRRTEVRLPADVIYRGAQRFTGTGVGPGPSPLRAPSVRWSSVEVVRPPQATASPSRQSRQRSAQPCLATNAHDCPRTPTNNDSPPRRRGAHQRGTPATAETSHLRGHRGTCRRAGIGNLGRFETEVQRIHNCRLAGAESLPMIVR